MKHNLLLSDSIPLLANYLDDHGALSVAFVRKHLKVSLVEAKDILEEVTKQFENVYWHKEKWIIIEGREKELPPTFWK
jgi:hypothetical protein